MSMNLYRRLAKLCGVPANCCPDNLCDLSILKVGLCPSKTIVLFTSMKSL